jgi:hypothetical protein
MNESYFPPRLSGFFILLLSFVIFLSATILFLINQKSTNQITTTGWLTYTNSLANFSIQYPPHLTMYKTDLSGISPINELADDSGREFYLGPSNSTSETDYYLSFSIVLNSFTLITDTARQDIYSYRLPIPNTNLYTSHSKYPHFFRN